MGPLWHRQGSAAAPGGSAVRSAAVEACGGASTAEVFYDPVVNLAEALERDFTIDLTTIGRRSGLPRRIEIWYLLHHGAIYITGTPGPRDWYANVLANPAIIFHLKESLRADIPGRAEVITDPALRHAVFHAPKSDWYRSMESVEVLVAESPMIRCDLRLEEAVLG